MADAEMVVAPRVTRALAQGQPVVALETAVLTHGLPAEVAWETYRDMLSAVRAAGAVPAPVAMVDGTLWLGLADEELAPLASAANTRKLGLSDLAAAAAGGASGGTTVAATLWACRRGGVAVFATGGIGGVHRGAERSFDLSGDLAALARLGGCVVCSGAKVILDLPKTLEVLYALGVTLVGYGTSVFPAFVTADSGLPLAHRVEDPAGAAEVVRARDALGLSGSVVVLNPPPPERAVPAGELATALDSALAKARAAGVSGPAVTPFLLAQLARDSGGASLRANRALLVANAALAARIAAELAGGRP